MNIYKKESEVLLDPKVINSNLNMKHINLDYKLYAIQAVVSKTLAKQEYIRTTLIPELELREKDRNNNNKSSLENIENLEPVGQENKYGQYQEGISYRRKYNFLNFVASVYCLSIIILILMLLVAIFLLYFQIFL